MPFLQVYDAISRHVDWDVVKCLVIAGPGFTKDSFKAFLEAEAVRQDNRYPPAATTSTHVSLDPQQVANSLLVDEYSLQSCVWETDVQTLPQTSQTA